MLTNSCGDSYEQSLRKPEDFWLSAAARISWFMAPRRALASRAPLYRWFPDGVLNTSYNALDRHVEAGRGDQDALIYDSAMLGTRKRFSYAELTGLVARFAGALRSRGVGKGDRVVIYMPMIPEAAIAIARHSAAGGSPFSRIRRVRDQRARGSHQGRCSRPGGHCLGRNRTFPADRVPSRRR